MRCRISRTGPCRTLRRARNRLLRRASQGVLPAGRTTPAGLSSTIDARPAGPVPRSRITALTHLRHDRPGRHGASEKYVLLRGLLPATCLRQGPRCSRPARRGDMEDPTTIALNLTFFGTLGVAFFMFLGLFLVFAATLVLAGIGRLAAVVVLAVAGLLRGSPGTSGKIGRLRTSRRPKPPPGQGREARRPARNAAKKEPALSPEWAAAVARADARAAARARAEAGPAVRVTVRDLPNPMAPAQDITEVSALVRVGHGHQRNTWRRPAGVQKAAHARSEVPAGHRLARGAARHSAGREGQTAGPGTQGRLSPYPGQASPLRWNPWNSDTSGTAASRFRKSRSATG